MVLEKTRLLNEKLGFFVFAFYLRLHVEEMRLENNALKIKGSYSRLTEAVDNAIGGPKAAIKPGKLASYTSNWCARWDESGD